MGMIGRVSAGNPSDSLEAQVLVIGAGPVGLAAALEMGLRGISVIVVEERTTKGAQPRAKTSNTRTMQHMRRWGVAQKLRDAAMLPADYPTDVVFSTKLYGRTLAVIENAFEGSKVRDPRFPEPAQWVPQYTVEAVLKERIAELANVTILSGQSFQALEQSSSSVVTTVMDLETEERRTIRTAYLVGADGARSPVRGAIGVKMEGNHAYALNYNVILRIPEFAVTPPAPRAIMYWVVDTASPCVIAPLSPDLWAFSFLLPPGVTELPNEELLRRINLAVGRHVESEIVTIDLWAAHRLIASRYRNGRVLLAGDACHLHPPYGGYGMNLGVADGVDVGWKLAATLQGWGGPELLDSYETERRPVHIRTIEEAVANYSVMSDHLLRAGIDKETPQGDRARAALEQEIHETKTREFQTLGVVLGSHYTGSPVIVADGSAAPQANHARFEPSAHPGCLAPHAWLADGTSIYDSFGTGYTLLQLGDGKGVDEGHRAATAVGVPLKVLDMRAAGLESLYGAPLALIRPDHHVAWRGTSFDLGILDIARGMQPVSAHQSVEAA